MIRSADRTVDSRWAKTRAARRGGTPASASRIRPSVTGSTLDVASSSRRMRGSRASARANDTLWRCPVDSRTPRPPPPVAPLPPPPRRQPPPAPPAARRHPLPPLPREPVHADGRERRGNRGAARGDVLDHRPREEERFLEDQGEEPAGVLARELPELPP